MAGNSREGEDRQAVQRDLVEKADRMPGVAEAMNVYRRVATVAWPPPFVAATIRHATGTN